MSTDPVSVRLLDREFLVACAADERAGLLAAAQLIDTRMRDLRSGTGGPGFDRIAVLVALSIAHEFLALQKRTESSSENVDTRLSELSRRIEAELDAGRAERA